MGGTTKGRSRRGVMGLYWRHGEYKLSIHPKDNGCQENSRGRAWNHILDFKKRKRIYALHMLSIVLVIKRLRYPSIRLHMSASVTGRNADATVSMQKGAHDASNPFIVLQSVKRTTGQVVIAWCASTYATTNRAARKFLGGIVFIGLSDTLLVKMCVFKSKSFSTDGELGWKQADRACRKALDVHEGAKRNERFRSQLKPCNVFAEVAWICWTAKWHRISDRGKRVDWYAEKLHSRYMMKGLEENTRELIYDKCDTIATILDIRV